MAFIFVFSRKKANWILKIYTREIFLQASVMCLGYQQARFYTSDNVSYTLFLVATYTFISYKQRKNISNAKNYMIKSLAKDKKKKHT